MSGETEAITESGSVNSALLWTDNPEVEYFRALMNEQGAERVASGMDMDDSLVGDSTLQGILDDQQSTPDSLASPQRLRRDVDNPAGGVETSGLSVNENDTVENIRTQDGSLEAWFSHRQRDEAIDAAFEVGTLETTPDIPPYQRQPFSSSEPPPPYPHEASQQEQTKNIGVDPEHIPGFIFVTCGHSSVVQTCALSRSTSSQPAKSLYYDDVDDDEENGLESSKNISVYQRIVIVCLLVAVIIVAILLAVLFSHRSNSVSSSAQAVGAEAPSFAPLPPILSPTIGLSTLGPSIISRQPPASSLGGDPTATSSPSSPASPSNSRPTRPTLRPSAPVQEAIPTPTMPSVVLRLENLAPDSVTAWLDPTSPQIMAMEWLVNDPQATSLSDLKLMQRYVLATLYFSTDGSGWNNPLSWVVESLEECEWSGIECDDSGGVKVIRLPDENLSGPLPAEIHLLSDTLEEVYLNSNQISGTIPTSVGLLANLHRLELTGNRLTGSLPTELGNMSNAIHLSFKRNEISGTLPTEIGLLQLIGKYSSAGNIPMPCP